MKKYTLLYNYTGSTAAYSSSGERGIRSRIREIAQNVHLAY